MSGNRVDVVMSTYNCAKFLPETIQSILSQTLQDFRLIIVDDGSSDESHEILESFACKDNRITIITQKNGGIVSAVNAGLALCTAPYIARHDADDISDPDRFEKELAWLEANPDCVAVSSLPRTIDERGAPASKAIRAKDLSLVRDDSYPANEPYIMQPMLMVRRDALEKAGGYRKLPVAEDADLYWRLQKLGSLHVLPEELGAYRMHAGSISSSSIIRGRQLAVWSQISALSAQRRRKGLPDIEFTDALSDRMNAAGSLADMYRILAEQCSSDEKNWLALAISAKLLETCYYRDYEPDREDIRFIRETISRNLPVYHSSECVVFREAVLSASIRLLITGRVVDAFMLTEVRRWPVMAGRAAFRGILSDRVRGWIKSCLPRKLIYGHK